jgi:hypothetical protein
MVERQNVGGQQNHRPSKMTKTMLYALTMNAVASAMFLLHAVFEDPTMSSQWKAQRDLLQEWRVILIACALYFVANTALLVDYLETTAAQTTSVVKVKAARLPVKSIRRNLRSKTPTKKD